MRSRVLWRKIAVGLLLVMGGALLCHILESNIYSCPINSEHFQFQQRRIDALDNRMKAQSLDKLVKQALDDGTRIDEDKFRVSSSFRFPQPHYSKPDSFLLRSAWVKSLKEYLGGIQGKQISLVTSTEEHTDVLVNWLISAYLVAKPPLDNVLVLSMGKSLHDLLDGRGFSSLYVSADMVISPRANITRVFSQVHIVRLTVIRLINHLGFDVVNYDCDAILLRNPQKLFDARKNFDLMGTFGKGPAHLYQKWGVTLNTGVMMLRATPQIEYYWERMSLLKWTTTDDQASINLVLDTLNVLWVNFQSSENIDNRKEDIIGVIKLTNPEFKMFVNLFSFDIVCRHTCTAERRSQYYVWHALAIKENRTVVNKVSQARVGSAWFLKENWEELSQSEPALQLEHWLSYITDKLGN